MATNYDAIFGDIVFSDDGAPAAWQAAISDGHDINCTDNSDNWNALHYVLNPIMSLPNTDVVRVLIDNGCSVNSADREQWTPLHFAARTGCPDTIALLLDAGADPNALDRGSVTPFHRYFLRRGIEPAVVRLFVQHGAIPTDAHRNFANVCDYPEKKHGFAASSSAGLTPNMVFTLGLRHTAVVCSGLPLLVESAVAQVSFASFRAVS